MDYSPDVERRFESPAVAGTLADPRGVTAAGEAEDRVLNVWIRFEVQAVDGRIDDVRFRVYGCPHTIAAADWAADALRGAPVEALERLDVERMRAELGIPTEKLGKLLRIEDAARGCAQGLAHAAGGRSAHV